mmetsp:Transcript_109798/g.354485  ORF Transcript_109798/g.354485 Transcript_109798/m.354485 type:complete len:85 (-) Transcript_109798:25-279(-)
MCMLQVIVLQEGQGRWAERPACAACPGIPKKSIRRRLPVLTLCEGHRAAHCTFCGSTASRHLKKMEQPWPVFPMVKCDARRGEH